MTSVDQDLAHVAESASQADAPSIDEALRDRIHATALSHGFDLAGIAETPLPGSDEHRRQQERFKEWITQGRSGEMHYLQRADDDGEFLRSSVQSAVPWARSVILLAVNYNADAPQSIDPSPSGTGWIARYAWSGSGDPAIGESTVPTDYHDVMLRGLRRVEADLRSTFEDDASSIKTHCYVDTGPVIERHLAMLAGLGWIGKNTCLINQGAGSWFLLGVILTSLPLKSEARIDVAADRCGSCTRCMDACPTDALIAPHQMDASRCIAYLTIEKKGSIAEDLRSQMGRQIFGCDICQDVCPWNRRSPIGSNRDMQARSELINPSLARIAAMTNADFKRTFRGSPLERTGLKRLHRNVAIAMGNSGDEAHLLQLQAWSNGENDVLAETARWAIERIQQATTS